MKMSDEVISEGVQAAKPTLGKSGDIGEDNVLGAYCHFPIIGGALVPLIVYLLKGKENKELGFQAKQALVFQVAMLVAWFVGVIAIVIFSAMLTMGIGRTGEMISMLLWLILLSVMLVSLAFALMAAWKTFNKEHYEYPVIGAKLR